MLTLFSGVFSTLVVSNNSRVFFRPSTPCYNKGGEFLEQVMVNILNNTFDWVQANFLYDTYCNEVSLINKRI